MKDRKKGKKYEEEIEIAKVISVRRTDRRGGNPPRVRRGLESCPMARPRRVSLGLICGRRSIFTRSGQISWQAQHFVPVGIRIRDRRSTLGM